MPLCRLMARLLPVAMSCVSLAGCWSPPVATVQPQGPPRLIQDGVVVDSVAWPATVQAVDPSSRMITLQVAGDLTSHVYPVGRRVTGFDHFAAGDRVYALIREKLTVRVSGDSPPGAAGAPQPFVGSAKVLSLDVSYRLLTLQYPTGRSETFKVKRGVELKQMQAGDDVSIQPLEVIAVAAHKPWWR